MKTNTEKTAKRIGIYGGSFNPVLISHMMVAKEVCESGLVDQIWIVPCGIRPDKYFAVESEIRLKLLEMSLEEWMPKYLDIRISDIELKENKQIPTYLLIKKFSSRIFLGVLS